MARRRWVNGKLRIYSNWFDEKVFNYDIFSSKQAVLNWFKSNDYRGSSHNLAVDFLIDYIKKNNFKNIVSFGSGSCSMECLIKQALPGVTVVATEYENKMVETVKPFFKELTIIQYDLYKDNIWDLQDRLDIDFDFAFFSASAYVMDKERFVEVFKSLNDNGIHDVVDNSGGVVDDKRSFGWFLHRLYNAAYYMLHEELKHDLKYIPINRPYGYGRTVKDLRRLYNKAGYDVIDDFRLKNCPIFVLKTNGNQG